MNVDTGITSEVFTIKSETKLIDIFNDIITIKSDAVFDYIESLNINANSKIIVIGTYFTGVGIVKKLSEKYENITLIDIYPHLEDMLHTSLGGELKNKVNFTSNLDLIYTGDIVIDTTGFGGINVEQSSKFDVDVFIIEDPVAEDNDNLLAEKNNIHERLDVVKSQNKAIIKTKFKNLSVIRATIDLAGAELELYDLEEMPENFTQMALDSIKDDFDYIFIDCPPSLGMLTVKALSISDGVVIPMQCEFYSLEGMSQLLNTVKKIFL